MEAPYTSPRASVAEAAVATHCAVSWAAILAGTAVAISISILLLLLGSGLGFSALTPSAGHAASPTTLAALAAVWIIIVQWVSAAAGGYLTGRLRTRWVGTQPHEIFFRDTAHGFVMWAVATVIVAIFVTSAASSMVAGGLAATPYTATGPDAGSNAPTGSVAAYDVAALFRSSSADADSRAKDAPSTDPRGEATRILTSGLSAGDVPATDRTYLASLVAARTGVSASDAQTRVDEIVARVQEKAGAARKAVATVALMNALAMLIGAFVACASAALGGRERDCHP